MITRKLLSIIEEARWNDRLTPEEAADATFAVFYSPHLGDSVTPEQSKDIDDLFTLLYTETDICTAAHEEQSRIWYKNHGGIREEARYIIDFGPRELEDSTVRLIFDGDN